MDKADRVCRELGQRIIELRREAGLTQEGLAERMEIDARDLRRIEGGDNTTVHTLVRLATALKVELGDLFVAPKQTYKRRPGRPRAS